MCRKFVAYVVAVIAFLASAEESKAQYDTLKFGDFGVTSVSPVDSVSVRGSVWVDVENPQVGFWVTEIYGKLYI